MFTLENILNYTSANIQIIGVFIAIIVEIIISFIFFKMDNLLQSEKQNHG